MLSIVGIVSSLAVAAPFPAESAWTPVTQDGVGIGDPTTDGQNNSREIVGSAAEPAVFIATDASFFYVRLRLDETPLQTATKLRQFGWGVLIDIDGDLSDYDLSVLVDGTREQIIVGENTNKSGKGDPTIVATDMSTYPIDLGADGNCRVLDAVTTFNGNSDYFLDFAVPPSALEALGMTSTTPIRIVGGASSNSTSLSTDLAGSDAPPSAGVLPDAFSDPVYPDGSPVIGVCPDGVVGTEEACDDGNSSAEDGCSPSCTVEQGFSCFGSPSVCRADSDGDGIVDDGDDSGSANDNPCTGGVIAGCDDNCVDVENPDQADTDADGIGDACDIESDDDGISNDGSGDGVLGNDPCVGGETLDCDDNCPSVANLDQADQDADGIGDVCDDDADGDGLANDVELELGLDPTLADSDSDGTSDFDDDLDDDGIPNGTETNGGTGAIDSDGDDVPDALDRDSDDDGALDEDEGTGDGDGDGIANYRDPDDVVTERDDDGDGIPDDVELGGGGLFSCSSGGAPFVLALLLFTRLVRRRH